MRKELTYKDAVNLLGGDDPAVAAVDRALGGALSLATGGISDVAINAFDAKGALIASGKRLSGTLKTRLKGAARAERTRRLEQAHAVIVVTAYFEILDELDLPFSTSDLELSTKDQIRAPRNSRPLSSSVSSPWLRLLTATPIPLPSPELPYEKAIVALQRWYGELSSHLLEFIAGLDVFDNLDDTRQGHVRTDLVSVLPARAVSRYEELYSSLARDAPEFHFWLGQREHQATREEVRRALTDLEKMVASVRTPAKSTSTSQAVASIYRGLLAKPILAREDSLADVEFPTLGEAYIDPDYQVRKVGNGSPADEAWWEECPVRQDLPQFLTGHLFKSAALDSPVIILGQPGGGKSVLTTVLAARLPPDAFTPVRVILRDVPADADVQEQIEEAIRSLTHERVSWADFARSLGGAVPVVMFDGFDELLQATGVGQSDYLMKISDFQRREADQDRPFVAMVTSRSAVADRARYPVGTTAIRLQPFRQEQAVAWLTVWNRYNVEHLSSRHLRPLSEAVLFRHWALASQPLLLLMLALYDAVENHLQQGYAKSELVGAAGQDSTFDEATLYEELLRAFARREVVKGTELLQDEVEEKLEEVLQRLSIVAFAIMNRRRQWVTVDELDRDFDALLQRVASRYSTTHRPPLTSGVQALGRFFFIQRAQATRDGQQLSTYEFLHASFGEYLVARHTARLVRRLRPPDEAEQDIAETRPRDDLQFAMLSFSALSSRQVVRFLRARLHMQTPAAEREALAAAVLKVHEVSRYRSYVSDDYRDYRPATIGLSARHGIYSANLILVALLLQGSLPSSSIFPESLDPPESWHRHVLLWRSSLRENDWADLASVLAVERVREAESRSLTISYVEASAPFTSIDPLWLYKVSKTGEAPVAWSRPYWDELRHKMEVSSGTNDGVVLHALEPVFEWLGATLLAFVELADGKATSVANTVLSVLLAGRCARSDVEVIEVYKRGAEVLPRLLELNLRERDPIVEILVDCLGRDLQRLPASVLLTYVELFFGLGMSPGHPARARLWIVTQSARQLHGYLTRQEADELVATMDSAAYGGDAHHSMGKDETGLEQDSWQFD